MLERNPFAALLFVSLCGLLVASPAAHAADPGDVGIFADAQATVSSVEMQPWSPRTLYVVAFPPDHGMRAFEMSVTMPPELVASWSVVPPAPTQMEMADHSWIVALQNCQPGGAPALLIELSVTATAPVIDAAICIDQMSPEGLASMAAGVPGYSDCVQQQLHPFTAAQNGQGVYPDGCLIVNPTAAPPVAVEPLGFGALKARY